MRVLRPPAWITPVICISSICSPRTGGAEAPRRPAARRIFLCSPRTAGSQPRDVPRLALRGQCNGSVADDARGVGGDVDDGGGLAARSRPGVEDEVEGVAEVRKYSIGRR